MGTVFQAIDDRTGRLVAVKVIRKSAMQRPNALERFKREIAALGKLRHPNIVAAYGAGQLGAYHYLVMEYIDGRDVGYWVAKLKRLPIDMACEIARQSALGLDHAHRLGFIHRDVKPSNLIAVRKPDGALDVRILDFGLARSYDGSADEARVTRTGQIVGTVDYLAPEQAQGSKTVDGRADVYSLGVTLFEMIAGRTPFIGDTMMARLVARVTLSPPLLSDFAPEAPSALVDAVAKSLAPRAEDRFATAADFAAALDRVRSEPTKSAATLTMTTVQTIETVQGTPNSRTPESSAPVYDEFQQALTDKAQPLSDSQQFQIPSLLTRNWHWIAGGVAALALVLLIVAFSRGSSTHQSEAASVEALKAPSPIVRLSEEAAALVERPDPSRIQRLWKEIWSLTDARHAEDVRHGARTLTTSAPHPLDATFTADEVQRTIHKPGFLESFGAGERLRKLAVSPDGRTAASLSRHGVELHDLIANATEELTADDLRSPTCLAFSPSGDSLAVGAQNGTVHLWEMSGRTQVQTFPGHGITSNIAFLADGSGLVSTHAPKQMIVRRFQSRQSAERTIELPHAPATLTLIPNSETVLVGSFDGRTTVVDLRRGVVETNWPSKAMIKGAEYRPDGRLVVVFAEHATCWRIDGGGFAQVWNFAANANEKWAAGWSSPWFERLVTMSSSGRLQLRSWKTGEVEWEREALTGFRQAAALAVSPDGRFAAVQAKDGGIELVKLPAFQPSALPPESSESRGRDPLP